MERKSVRYTISLPAAIADQIDSIAAARQVSANDVIADLLTNAAAEFERRKGPEEPTEAERLREQLARLNFSH